LLAALLFEVLARSATRVMHVFLVFRHGTLCARQVSGFHLAVAVLLTAFFLKASITLVMGRVTVLASSHNFVVFASQFLVCH
jgi:hypothetical protein